jgi:tRNA A-37 threonylcarbamoyl transferase component Bud32
MRLSFKPSPAQRAALRGELVRLQQPAATLEVLRSVLPRGFQPSNVVCTIESRHPDRFVLRAKVESEAGEVRSYALKGYSDDFGERVWAHAEALARSLSRNDGLCLPITYVPEDRLLIFPWVQGPFLSEIWDSRKPELMRQAARTAARLHRLKVAPEAVTTAQMLVDETRAWCERLRGRWPRAAPIVQPLVEVVQEALPCLEPATPAPVHGDMASGQFLWTGDRLVLLDLDMFGYTDPAYDAGHFLAQLERRCLVDPTVRSHLQECDAAFTEAYLEAMPQVSPRNIWFYRSLTLVRKCYTICRREPVQWPRLIPQFAERARAALEAARSAKCEVRFTACV